MRLLASEQPKELKRFVKFATVGALGSLTDFVVLNILVQLMAAPLAIANAASFIAAVVQNFTLNRKWTFPESQERKTGNQLLKFAIVSTVGLGLNMVIFLGVHNFLEPYWHQLITNSGMAFTMSYNFAKLFAIGVVLFWNFAINRLWTYRGL